jgi:ribosomal protein L17
MAFPKGKSGNPEGRRKDKKARDALVMTLLKAGEDMPRLRKVWEAIITKAEDGDVGAAREIFDRLDGKVPQGIVGDDDADPINVLSRIERIIVKPKG